MSRWWYKPGELVQTRALNVAQRGQSALDSRIQVNVFAATRSIEFHRLALRDADDDRCNVFQIASTECDFVLSRSWNCIFWLAQQNDVIHCVWTLGASYRFGHSRFVHKKGLEAGGRVGMEAPQKGGGILTGPKPLVKLCFPSFAHMSFPREFATQLLFCESTSLGPRDTFWWTPPAAASLGDQQAGHRRSCPARACREKKKGNEAHRTSTPASSSPS